MASFFTSLCHSVVCISSDEKLPFVACNQSRPESHTKSYLNTGDMICSPVRADRTRHVLVIDEYRALEEWWRQGKTERTRRQKLTTLLLCQTRIS
jgi:hypothetical protein